MRGAGLIDQRCRFGVRFKTSAADVKTLEENARHWVLTGSLPGGMRWCEGGALCQWPSAGVHREYLQHGRAVPRLSLRRAGRLGLPGAWPRSLRGLHGLGAAVHLTSHGDLALAPRNHRTGYPRQQPRTASVGSMYAALTGTGCGAAPTPRPRKAACSVKKKSLL